MKKKSDLTLLLVAPDLASSGAALKYGREEIEDILQSGLTVTPKIGRVDSTDLVRLLSSGEFDAVWFVTHGTVAGLMLSDGLFPYRRLAPLVKGRTRLVVINACDGLQTAQVIQNETKASIITSVKPVDDGVAYQFGSLLARNLAALQTISAAYHNSIPANNDGYVYLAGEQERVVSMDWSALYTELAKVAESVHGLRTEVALLKQNQATTTEMIRLHQEQTNEKLTRFEGLLDEFGELVTALQSEDQRIEREVRNLPKPKANPFWSQAMVMIAGLLLCEIVLFFLMLWAFRATGGLP